MSTHAAHRVDATSQLNRQDIVESLCVVGICVLAIWGKAEFQQFTSNQHTYLAHAASHAKFQTMLGRDWFAGTSDPAPLFSLISEPLLRLGNFSLSLANTILGVIFLGALSALFGERRVLGLLAPALLGIAWVAVEGILRRVLFYGVAEQQAYSPYFQPANFGVLLVLGVWLAFQGRATSAVAVASIAAWIHPTYVFSALVFTLGVSASIVQCERDARQTVRVAVLGCLCVLPPAAFGLAAFSPTSAQLAHRAAEVLVTKRFPHHANIANWFGWGTIIQCFPIVGALAITRGRRRVMLLWWFASTVVASLTVAGLHRPELELLFPWRCSVWLAPSCTAISLGAAVTALLRYAPTERQRRLLAGAAIVGLAAAAVVMRLKKPLTNDFRGVHLARSIPETERRKWTTVIPLDWEGLRLNTPLPVFVDFKSHPYKDVEVLEWERRLTCARAVYEATSSDPCRGLRGLLEADEQVGFVIAPRATGLDGCASITSAARDEDGILYRIRGRTAPL